MDAFKEYLGQVRVPRASQPIYKDECVYSFDTPESEHGLYVSLSTFLGFGAGHVQKFAEKTGNAVFLHIRTKKLKKNNDGEGADGSASCGKDEAPRKITRLAIGLEGGYNDECSSAKYEYQHIYTLVVAPHFHQEISYPNPELPVLVVQSVEAILSMESAITQMEKQTLMGTWDGEARKISDYAHALVQLDNGKKIPPSGWQCEKCDMINNLWLNLTDGAILCGRKFFDGSGGNNHALEHYSLNGYPMAVKLGTISADGKSDVYSYPEDDMVIDPYLEQHLAHFGINMAAMKKSEKSMLELELEINRRIGEWSLLTESDSELQPLAGAGFTGMRNLGNSCYINSVMQVLFVLPDFKRRYVGAGAQSYFEKFPDDPANDFDIQMSKLGEGLWSGKYSRVADNSLDSEQETGIAPFMFKNVIGKNHVDFSSKQQQDAYDFYLHVLNVCERHSRGQMNPADALTFVIEERVECLTSQQVKYTQRTEYSMPLEIPLDMAINKEQVEEYLSRKLALESNNNKHGKKIDGVEAVHPLVTLESCLERFFAPETIEQFYSTAINGTTLAKKTTRLATMPDFLMLHLRKFTLSADWTPKKIDVRVQMPDEIDLSDWRAQGLQPYEQLLPDNCDGQAGAVGATAEPKKFEFDESIMSELLQMGYPKEACKRAIYHTANGGLEAASNWLMDHIADSDLSDPFIEPASTHNAMSAVQLAAAVVNPESLAMLMSMGFDERQARKALVNTDGNIERATDWIFSHIDDDMETDEIVQAALAESTAAAATATASSASSVGAGVKSQRDGSGKYKLMAFISHMGTSAQVGHYVCHILKDGKWVIYNDSKVALSQKPPKELGYLYLYQRA